MTLILATILGGVFYRLGGMGFDGWMHFRYLPQWLFDSKARDAGIPLVMLAYMAGHWHWTLIICAGLMFAAQTTYFKKKGEDATAFNWLLCGLAFGLAMLPYSVATGNFIGFLLRLCILIIFVPVWSVVWGSDTVEEMGRGGIQILTLALII